MRAGRALALAAFCLLASGCYHQVVQTGKTPGPTVVNKPWAPSFLWGLVAVPTIDVTSECRNGIATVMTEQSFANGLVSALLFGLYTPRHVSVTCAASIGGTSSEFYVSRDASPAEREAISAQAIDASARSGQPVTVTF